MREYKICSRCIMDTTSDPNLILDENGICNYCHNYDSAVKTISHKRENGKEKLEQLFQQIKNEGKGRDYDCLLGISGGVDSSYLAYLAKQYGLRVLAVHVDAGWNSELAVQNIENMCKKLDFDLHTVVIDWPTIREMQRAYLFSGLANLDVVQDHAFVSACREMCKKFRVKYILSGYNYATEGILSTAFQYSWHDWRCIKSVCKKHGRKKIDFRKYPHQNFMKMYFLNPIVHGVKTIAPLDYIDYSKKMAIDKLEKEYNWKYYGGKHYESRFTKFFQEVYLPQKFGWDKRRDHISSLIVGGEMTREEALKEIETAPSIEEELEEERRYVLKKLDISEEEWKDILSGRIKTEDDYKNDKRITYLCIKIRDIVVKRK